MDNRALPLFGASAKATQTVNASPTSTTLEPTGHCTPFTLPSLGAIVLDADTTITLSHDVLFHPACTGVIDITQNSISSALTDLRDPFYASTIPQCYALAATTVMAYTLVIMLLVTPRSFLRGGAVILGRRGFTNGPSGEAGIGIGGRPWLQKVAALTVAISLTIASVDTFKVAQDQYEIGFMDATALQQQVLDGLELKIMRIISDTFLWLAQAQTLIRLFPRQREKVIIKWTAFALILLDLIFGILDSFVVSTSYTRPTSFNEAIPALSYLFQLALGVLYCAWVIYYSITKKQYAFYHSEMRNVCLVALLSIVSLFVPVVFFLTDIINHDVAAWGDYVRWVGAAAASVVVWEWVERIEALERNDKKDGVLGREVFDGDEMLKVVPHDQSPRSDGDNIHNTTSSSYSKPWPAMAGVVDRCRPHLRNSNRRSTRQELVAKKLDAPRRTSLQLSNWPARAAQIATPVSRTDTASAESTVYAVRYHPIGVGTQSLEEVTPPLPGHASHVIDVEAQTGTTAEVMNDGSILPEKQARDEESDTPVLAPPTSNFRVKFWETVERVNPLSHRSRQPPAELVAHTRANSLQPSTTEKAIATSSSLWDIRGRLEDFASIQAERLQNRGKHFNVNAPTLPVTRIPAPPRNRTAQEMADLMEDNQSITRHTSGIIVGDGSPPVQRSLLYRSNIHSSPTIPEDQYIIQTGISPMTIPRSLPLRDYEARSQPPCALFNSHSQLDSAQTSCLSSDQEAEITRNTSNTSRHLVRTVSRTSKGSPTQFAGAATMPSTVEGGMAGLQIIRIPPPPRRRRTDDEE